LVDGEKRRIFLLNPKQRIKMDNFNLIEHKNLGEMESSIKKLNKLICKWDIPNAVLTSTHLQGILGPPKMELNKYYEFLHGPYSNDARVENYKDYVKFTSLGPINLEEPLVLSNGQLKYMVTQHNLLRINNYNRLTLASPLSLDHNIYSEDYLNRINQIPKDVEPFNQEFVNYQSELDFLNSALNNFMSTSDNEKFYFETFKKRQLSYHLYMIENLLSSNKFGLSLNREIKLVDGKPSRDLFTLGQQKSIIAASNIKFLYPNHNDFNFLVKDFTSSDQTYQELVENILYVQLKYMLSFKRLEFLNSSVSLNKFFTADNLSSSEKEKLILKINEGLETVSINHIKKNFSSYKQLGDYYQYRILTQTNKGCRVNIFDNMDKKYYINSFLLSKNRPLHGVSTQLTSTLGLNTARDFAFYSPFISPYGG
jgi:hypothetical protein